MMVKMHKLSNGCTRFEIAQESAHVSHKHTVHNLTVTSLGALNKQQEFGKHERIQFPWLVWRSPHISTAA